MALLGCGCAGLLLLALVGGGVGGAYYLGWFGPEDVYATPPPPCELLDVDTARGIAGNGENLEVFEDGYSALAITPTEGLECGVIVGWGSEVGHGVRMRVSVFPSQQSGLEMHNGTEAAEGFLGSFTDGLGDLYELVPSTCPGGEPVLTGTLGNPSGDYGFSVHQRANLVLEAEVRADPTIQDTLNVQERAQTAEDLLCDAMTRL